MPITLASISPSASFDWDVIKRSWLAPLGHAAPRDENVAEANQALTRSLFPQGLIPEFI
ncbi:hypothetical protein RE6C_03895 [Rhodopirellula europaea 6C]|uniref:Uncharacterized protein n=1 Tax=Rhodopirellula europaea 6C TaxID=1263867 RepID=M2B0R8_9BACT|nr:hypothetical protein RE6C_03895 [Rhodopirellula europaea 6C]